MALGDVMPNYLPKNVFESDDEIDNWSSLSGSSNSSGSSCQKVETDFSLFQDYFGLSNLLNNVKISEDNPLLYSSHRNLFNRRRRLSLESEGSDTNAVTSPRLENSHAFDLNSKFPNPESKTLPPPSMRLSKADRDMIISGIYTKQLVLEQQQMHPSSKTAPQQQIPSPVHPPSPPHQCPSPPQEPATNRAVSMNVCVFCRNNGENENVYTSHVLKDTDGRTSCPILRAYTCPICKANGDNSHTIKYCPLNQNGRANTTFPPPPSQQQMPPPLPPMGMMPPQRTPAGFPQPPMRNFRPPFPNFPPPPNARIPQAAGKSR